MLNDIYLVPIRNMYLLWSPQRRLSVFLNRSGVGRLRSGLEGINTSRRGPDVMQDIIQHFRAPLANTHIPEGSPKPAFLGLIPTRRCNLSCNYCGFGAQGNKDENMSYDLAVNAIDWMANSVVESGHGLLEIHFFGGEPFVAGDVIDVAVHKARSVSTQYGLIPYFEVATNGVFDMVQAKFIRDYFDMVVLSFDGPQEIHDRHRPMNKTHGSFVDVARSAEYLGKSNLDLCFRTCVSNLNVNQLESIARWYCTAFKPSSVSFSSLKPNSESEASGLSQPDPYKFAENYLRACEVLEHFGVKSVYAAAEITNLKQCSCPVGSDVVIVSPDGRISSCYLLQQDWLSRGMDMDIGRIGPDGLVQIEQASIDRLRRMVVDKPLCSHCFCKWSCNGGCHVIHSFPGGPTSYNDFCIQTRIITACLLLKSLGLKSEVRELLSDREALEKLAKYPTDCLEDWHED